MIAIEPRAGVEAGEFPSLDKEGWLRDQEDFAKPHQLAQTGWLVQATDDRLFERTTPSAPNKVASRHFS